MYAIIADYSRVEIIRVSKKFGYNFNQTGLLTVFDEMGQPSEGYWLLGNILSSSLSSLGFEPVIPPKCPISFDIEDNDTCRVDKLIPLRAGTKKRAFLWKAMYSRRGGSKKRKQEFKPCILKYSKVDPQVSKEIEILEALKHPLIPRLLGLVILRNLEMLWCWNQLEFQSQKSRK